MSQTVINNPTQEGPTTSKRVNLLFLFLGLSLGTLLLGGLLTSLGMDEWYANLRKPPFQPPGWVFSPAWTIIMALLAVATWRITSRIPTHETTKTALVLYGIQLVLNLCWSLLFFALHSPTLALIEIAFLDVVVLAMVVTYWRLSAVAGAMLVPYFIWLMFATALNVWIVIHN